MTDNDLLKMADFWSANQSYNAAIIAEAKKIIEEATQ